MYWLLGSRTVGKNNWPYSTSFPPPPPSPIVIDLTHLTIRLHVLLNPMNERRKVSPYICFSILTRQVLIIDS